MNEPRISSNGGRVLITGGSGFVGTNLIEYFASSGMTVQNVDIRPPRNRAHTPYWRAIDLLDKPALVKAIEKFQPTLVLHMAARTDLRERRNLDSYAANIEGVLHLIEAMSKSESVERVVFASTQLVCRLGYRPQNVDDFAPDTLYGRSKALGEMIIRSAGAFSASWTIVRPTSLWGPWFGEPYRSLFKTIDNGWYVHVGGVNPLKQWGYVGNAVHQVAEITGAPSTEVDKRTFYLADYEPVPLASFTNKVQKELGARPIRTVPLATLKVAARLGDVASRLGYQDPPLSTFRLRNILASELQDVTPLQRVVGPLPYTLDEGIRATVEWLRSTPTPRQPRDASWRGG